MKRKALAIIAVLALSLSISGCGSRVDTDETFDTDNSSMFVVVEKASCWMIVYHKETKVMYAVSYPAFDYYNNGNFTLLVNPDGSPMLFEE